MSQENVERLRALYTKWETGDFRDSEKLFAPGVAFDPGSPGDKPMHGIDEVQSHFREFLRQWDGFRIVAEDLSTIGSTEEGDEMVLVVERQYGTGTTSGVPIDQTFYSVWTFHGGLVVSALWKTDREAALRAAGLAQ